jgi:hypothetical protein
MCWYSAQHFGQDLVNAEVGQRLCVRSMHWEATRWVVREEDKTTSKPAPVCLLDGTKVVLRPNESEQAALQIGPEPEAVFRMIAKPKRDVLEFEDGKQVEINRLPDGLIFDVLVVPGREHLSSVLEEKDKAPSEEEAEQEPLLVRLLHRF